MVGGVFSQKVVLYNAIDSLLFIDMCFSDPPKALEPTWFYYKCVSISGVLRE